MDFQAIEPDARLKHNLNMTASKLARTLVSRRMWALTLAFGSLIPAAAAKDMALISNKSNSLPPIALADLTKVCKGQLSRWPDGKPVTIVMHQPGTADLKIVEDKIY